MADYPSYPGVMTWRMRKHMDKWISKETRLSDDPAYKQAYTREVEYMWKCECDASKADAILKAYKENYYDSIRKPKTDKMLVTINAHQESINRLPDFRDKVATWSSQKHIHDIEYVFEQRGDTVETAGQGLHVHAIVTCDTNKSDMIRRTASTFKDYIGSSQAIDVRPIPLDLLDQKKAYIRGDKKSDEKKKKVVIDRIWRAQNNLREVYTRNGIHQAQSSFQQETEDACEEESNSLL